MSEYYNSKRTRGLYSPGINAAGGEPFRLSRSKIEMFMNCPKCFYLDRKLGVGQPPGFPFSLNSAVDALLKKEFDHYRSIGEPHPLMTKFGIEAVPFNHPKINEWRDAMRAGVTYLHKATNFFVTGAVDDIWESLKEGRELFVVDYKATAKAGEITELDQDWQISYKRQAEMYQWLLRANGFNVSKTAYFVYANGIAAKDSFGDKLEFDTRIIPYRGNDEWIGEVLMDIKECLDSDTTPESGEDCDYCNYRKSANEVLAKRSAQELTLKHPEYPVEKIF
jgi:CRISPR/Cas system-associated exonuclease Cas4 (RecB family)